jgi:hypothetical protein
MKLSKEGECRDEIGWAPKSRTRGQAIPHFNAVPSVLDRPVHRIFR